MPEIRRLHCWHILIVEDDPFTAKMLAEAVADQCAHAGHQGCFLVSITGWAEAAVEWLASGSFHGYIIDGNLKGRAHGLTVIERIRKTDETAPIVLHCSGAASMRGSAILHDFHNVEKNGTSASLAARHIVDSLFAPAA